MTQTNNDKTPATPDLAAKTEAKTRNATDFATEAGAKVGAAVDKMGDASDAFFNKGAEGASKAICAAPDTFAAAELSKMGAKSVEKASRAAVREAYARRLASRAASR